MTTVHFNVREDNQTVKKVVYYIAIGIKLNGVHKRLGMWIVGNESANIGLVSLMKLKTVG